MTGAMWSWADVRPHPSETVRVQLTVKLDAKTHRALRSMALITGQTVNELAAHLLANLVEDDTTAHAGGD